MGLRGTQLTGSINYTLVTFPCHRVVLGELQSSDPSQVEIVSGPSLNFKWGIAFEDNIWFNLAILLIIMLELDPGISCWWLRLADPVSD
jgi:hypothetical protein